MYWDYFKNLGQNLIAFDKARKRKKVILLNLTAIMWQTLLDRWSLKHPGKASMPRALN